MADEGTQHNGWASLWKGAAKDGSNYAHAQKERDEAVKVFTETIASKLSLMIQPLRAVVNHPPETKLRQGQRYNRRFIDTLRETKATRRADAPSPRTAVQYGRSLTVKAGGSFY